MTPERDEPILDACLEELLGQQTPPDLTARILQAWSARHGAAGNGAANGHVYGVPLAASEPSAPPVQGPPVLPEQNVRPAALSNRPVPVVPVVGVPTPEISRPAPSVDYSPRGVVKRARRSWASGVLAAGVAAAAVSAGIYWLASTNINDPQHPAPNVAQSPPAASGGPSSKMNASPAKDPGTTGLAQQQPAPGVGSSQSSSAPASSLSVASVDPKETSPTPQVSSPTIAANVPDQPSSGANKPKHPADSTSLASASPDQEVIAFINQQLRAAWEEQGVRASPPATDAEWCRRVYLRILGRIPTVEELGRFVSSKDAQKKSRLVGELLEGESYVEEYARNWSSLWTNLLIGRSGGMQPGSPVNREGMQQYLRQSLANNKPYDRLATELISATGSNTPGTEEYNGATNFLLGGLQDKATLATAKTSRIFLGMQVQCAQCHNHPSTDLTQEQFWAMNACFRQAKPVAERGAGAVRLVNQDFLGDDGDRPSEAGVYFEKNNGLMKIAFPGFLDGTQLSRSGRVADVDRRQELARLIVQSPYFSQAAVNRMWGFFLGFGFTSPVDDMGSHHPPSHPELLARLSTEFAAHQYDLKKLVRWIALSDAFGLSSKLTGDLADMPEYGQQPLFSRYYTRQMRAEEVYESLVIAGDVKRTPGREADRARMEWLGQFAIDHGTDEGDESTTFDGTIPQALMMMNGDLVRRAVSSKEGSLLHRVINSKMSTTEKVEHLFQAALARKPNKRELQVVDQLLGARNGDVPSVLQDIWWALLNSNEFILDH